MARWTHALAGLWSGRTNTPAEAKASRTGAILAIETLGRPVWTPRDYAAFAREGFMQNPIVYRSVRMVAEAAASIPLLLYERGVEHEAHPLLDLIARPNGEQTSADFFESWYGYLLVSGNAYAEAVALGGEVRELYALRPDRMTVVPGREGWPDGFEYSAAGKSVRFDMEPAAGARPILHLKLFHPANDHYGMSPIEAAATAIDIHNAAAAWNKALLDNSARPSGALVYGAREGRLTAEQFDRLKSELETSYQGARHAGRPLLLEGGLDWKPLSLSPKDMDFIEAKNAAAREIALAIGVPPMLLGIPGDNTYSNYQEAQRAFWRQSVLPLVARTAKALSAWLSPAWGGALELKPDLDQVEALVPEREALWARLHAASFLTLNEKREAAGYTPLDGKEDDSRGPFEVVPLAGRSLHRLLKYRPDQPRAPRGQPDGGQWVDEGLAGSDRVRRREGETRIAQAEFDRTYSVNLGSQDEELGGHTIRDHVGKTNDYLLDYVKQRTARFAVYSYGQQREGSFLTEVDANDLVNQSLNKNREVVAAVAKGSMPEVTLDTRFGYVTGKEAYRYDPESEPFIRATYSVRVVIRHDPRSKLGFKVLTAFPINERGR